MAAGKGMTHEICHVDHWRRRLVLTSRRGRLVQHSPPLQRGGEAPENPHKDEDGHKGIHDSPKQRGVASFLVDQNLAAGHSTRAKKMKCGSGDKREGE